MMMTTDADASINNVTSNNGLARRRKRRQSKSESMTNGAASDDDQSTIIFEDVSSEDIHNNNNNNGGGGMNTTKYHRSSSENNYLDAILKSASAAMGLTPVHHQPTTTAATSNNNGNATHHSRVDNIRSHSEHNTHSTAPLIHQQQHQHNRRASRRNSFQIKPPSTKNINNNNTDRSSFELKQTALIHSLQSQSNTLQHLTAMDNLFTEEQYISSQTLFRRLAIRSSHPDITQKELIQRSTFLVISTLTVGAGGLWGGMYVILGEWGAACLPFVYSGCMGVVLVTFVCRGRGELKLSDKKKSDVGGKSKSSDGKGRVGNNESGTTMMSMWNCIDTYDIYVECQLGLIMACPFAVHMALGGVEQSGGVMLWSFLCPMGAAFFRSARESLLWFWAYLGISAGLLAWEVWCAQGRSEVIQHVYFLMNIMGCMGVVYSAVFLFARELEREYTKSEEVLLNILPSKIVKRIKRGEFPIVDHVSSVTILFADLVGFTKASAELHPNFLVGLFLRDIFHAFDELVGKHGLEKIKTIGDAYMVVGGLDHSDGEEKNKQRRAKVSDGELPTHDRDGDHHHHPTRIMLLAQDMFHELTRINNKYNLDFSLRIGIHKGPVVAGVLGLKRFTYDVWGDSVNTASRMESNGVPNLIHLSSDMYQAVDGLTNDFDFSCCGKIQVKGKGEMTTYLAKPLR